MPFTRTVSALVFSPVFFGSGQSVWVPFTALTATVTFSSVSGSALFFIGWSCFVSWIRNRFRRRAFMQTVKLERLIAAAPIIGLISSAR